MAEYAKKTVAELTEILKSRGLPSSGKKAELVARLNEDDKNAESQPAEQATEEAQPDPAPAAQVEPTTTSNSTEPAEPTSTEADTTTAVTADAAATANATDPETATYTLNLKASDIDSELAKRKARAERFGTGTTEGAEPSTTQAATSTSTDTDTQALKNLERAKRFGTEPHAIGKLDEALPTERARGNKRKAEDSISTGPHSSSTLDDPGLKKGFANRLGQGNRGARGANRFRNRGGQRNTNSTAGRPQGVSKNPPAYTSEKDRLAAEARKKKFATA